MATNAAINDSPAMKPYATGTENVSALERFTFVQSQTMVAPMANDNEFWKTMTQDKPSPMEDGSQRRDCGTSLSHTGNNTPMSEPITMSQTAEAGSIRMPWVSKSATAFHMFTAGGLNRSSASLFGTIRYHPGTMAITPKNTQMNCSPNCLRGLAPSR